jgi:hypothetical protein
MARQGDHSAAVEMLDRVYGRHHPQHLKKAARSIGYRHANETLAVSLHNANQEKATCRNQLKSLVGLPGLEPGTRPL